MQTDNKSSFKKNTLILLSGLFLVMVGFGITLPVLSFYIQKLSSAGGISREKLWLHVGLITSAYPLMQFLFAPYLGSLSDRIGRRPLILTGLAGYYFFSPGRYHGCFSFFYVARIKKSERDKNIFERNNKEKTCVKFLKSAGHSFILLLFCSFISQFSLAMFEGTFALHSQRLFSFGARQMSMVFIVCGSVMGLLQLGPVGWLIKIWGEKKLLTYGLFILGAGMSLLMIPKKLGFILLFVSIIAVGLAILTPALASLITKDTGKNYGTSLGLFSAVSSLGQIFGVLAGSVLMIYFNHLPYFLVSFILILTACFSFSAFRLKKTSYNLRAIN